MKKKIILYLIAAFLIFGSIAGLYKINDQIPDGILIPNGILESFAVGGNSVVDGSSAVDGNSAAGENFISDGIFTYDIIKAEIQEAYKDLCAEIRVYHAGEMPAQVLQSPEIKSGTQAGTRPETQTGTQAPAALLIIPEKGAEQILAFTLKERYGDTNVRDLATERRMRLAALEVLACFALFLLINPVIFALLGKKGRNYRYLLRIVEFFVLCFLVSRRGILPAVCVPEKFIYFGEWWEKCRDYFSSLKKAGAIPCAEYQACAPLQAGLLAAVFVGIAAIVLMRLAERRRCKSQQKEAGKLQEK